MKVAIYSVKPFIKSYLDQLKTKHELLLIRQSLSLDTVELAQSCQAVCGFVLDDFSEPVLKKLSDNDIRCIALRSSGYDNVDLKAAYRFGMTVSNVPEYSPEAIAEFAIGMILSLNRNIHHAYNRGLQHDFRLDGLLGFNLYQKTVGIIGTGRIGSAFANIINGFGCRCLAYDPFPNEDLDVDYVSFEEVIQKSDIISLHCPLTDVTQHIIDKRVLSQMQSHAMLVNTGRGGLIDTQALIEALNNKKIAAAALDVYEFEKGIFFKDRSQDQIDDPLLLQLLAMPNVLITPHQAFFTKEAVGNIIKTTIDNLDAYQQGNPINVISSE